MANNILEILEATACRLPEKILFSDEFEAVTAARLEEMGRRIGSAIAALSAPFKPIAVLMENRSIHCVEMMMGVLYAGCYYSVIDSKAPLARIQQIVDSFQPTVIVVDEQTAELASRLECGAKLLDCKAARQQEVNSGVLEAIRQSCGEDSLVSVVYTSGSTGIPKGVVHSHRAYIAFTEATVQKYTFTEHTIFANQSPFFYANSMIDLFPPILAGATVHIMPSRLLSFPVLLIDYLNEHRITELTMTPSSYVTVANMGVLEPGCLPTLRYIILCGEVVPWPSLQRWMQAAPNAGIWNHYGSTEAMSIAVWRLDRDFSNGEVIPAGWLFDGVEIRLLDENGADVPDGEKGEIMLRNPWMSSGYYGDAEQTAQAYQTDPQGRRYFRTGDIGRFNEEKQLVVYGRRDQQIKRGGYRMELGEVEYALRAIPEWKDGYVIFQPEKDKLWCFFTGELSPRMLKNRLRARLQRYMVPDVFVHLDEMPHTANMKVDRKALRDMMNA